MINGTVTTSIKKVVALGDSISIVGYNCPSKFDCSAFVINNVVPKAADWSQYDTTSITTMTFKNSIVDIDASFNVLKLGKFENNSTDKSVTMNLCTVADNTLTQCSSTDMKLVKNYSGANVEECKLRSNQDF